MNCFCSLSFLNANLSALPTKIQAALLCSQADQTDTRKTFTMQFFTLILVLLGLTINLNAVASVIGPNSRDDSLDTMTNQTETTDTVAFINTTTLGGWPPFYSTSDPQNLCGDTVGIDKSSRGVPDSKDCAALRDKMDGNETLACGTSPPIPVALTPTSCSQAMPAVLSLRLRWTPARTACRCPSILDKEKLQNTDGFVRIHRIGSEDARDLLNDQATKFSPSTASSALWDARTMLLPSGP